MKNYVQPDDSLDIVAPVGGVTSGQGLLIGSIFGVVSADAAAGDPSVIRVRGVFSLPKAAVTITAWEKLYWDSTNEVLTNVPASNKYVGIAVEDAGNSAAEAKILLGHTFEQAGLSGGKFYMASSTVSAGEATANQKDINTGLGAQLTFWNVQVYRSGVDVKADAVVTALSSGDAGKLRVADGAATYNMTAGDVIHVVAKV